MSLTSLNYMIILADLVRERYLFLVYSSYNNELKGHEMKLAESCQRLMRDRDDIDNLNSN